MVLKTAIFEPCPISVIGNKYSSSPNQIIAQELSKCSNGDN